MYLTVEEAMSLLCSLSEAKKMKVDIKRQMWLIIGLTGAGAFVGGLAGGPPGLAVGSAIGGGVAGSHGPWRSGCGVGMFLSFWILWGKIKSIPQILKELPNAEKKKLHSHVMVIIGNLKWKDTSQLTKLVMGSEDLQERLLGLIEGYLTKELGTTVQHGD
ncbi:protein C19orf12 homolog [Myotis lucifugus]|uniref:protein C19orf12 homolog n=1 Tax=Myotis lucifugus TaxID=59463 RepID=UPI0003C4C5CD|nr:protein C19orf12 homolog [Myotis lucifugus]